jgi:hypothetical protein
LVTAVVLIVWSLPFFATFVSLSRETPIDTSDAQEAFVYGFALFVLWMFGVVVIGGAFLVWRQARIDNRWPRH